MLQRTRSFSHLLLAVLFALTALAPLSPVLAQDDEESEEVTAEDLYVDLEPEFVLNYGQESRLHFARVQVTVVAADSRSLPDINHHTPALRHIVVMTITGADREAVTTSTGRRELRAELLEKMQAYMDDEEAEGEGISDVLFRNFIVQ